jgi:hypothetical protein
MQSFKLAVQVIPRSFNRFILISLALLGFSTNSFASLVSNGSFENGAFSDEGFNYMDLSPGETSLSNWTIVNGNVAWGLNPTDGFSASDGVGVVDLSSFGASSTTGTVEQGLSTGIGTQYLFSFDIQGGVANVSIGGSSLTLSQGGTSNSWTSYTSEFTATTTLSLLSIANGGQSQIEFIDNVSVTEVNVPPAVPVPAAVWLFGTALIGLVGFSKRRKIA